MTYDYIIIGQGLAGTVLAHTLIDEGNEVLVIDDVPDFSSSLICAGVYNPITGKRLVKTWLAGEIFPFLERFYTDLEKKLNNQFIRRNDIKVPIYSSDRWNEAASRLNNEDYGQWMEMKTEKIDILKDEIIGTLAFVPSGNVNVEKLILLSRVKWTEENRFVIQKVSPENIKIENELVKVNNYTAKRLVWCEGYQAKNNPFFSWIPFAPVKGEILEIESETLSNVNILKTKNIFLLPLEGKRYKVGSTYDWDDTTETPTTEARKTLMDNYYQAFAADMKVIKQKAGIRPAVKDRRPIIGNHPQFTQISIFNGLGTKGVSLAPYFAKQAVDFWSGKGELNPEVDLKRFVKQYQESLVI